MEDHTWSEPLYYFVIIMEFCHGGNLLENIRSHRKGGEDLF